MSRSVLALPAALVLLLAGCVSPGATTDPASVESTTLGAAFGRLAEATGIGAHGYMASYVMTHPFRVALDTGPTPHMLQARADLVKELEGFGLEVVEHVYSPTGTNIMGIKRGIEKPDSWIVLTAHYDIVEETVYGAWDDGAGTAMLMELARAAALTDFRHTVVFLFTDEEEKGLLGSKAFVQDHFEQVDLVANLNFDPPGLNWPCRDATGPLPVKVIFDEEKLANGTAGYAELKAAVLAGLDYAEVPEEARDLTPEVHVLTVNGQGRRGSSDHVSFNNVEVPAVFIGSLPTRTLGPLTALTYSLHTPIDTLAQMETRCGGASLLQQAFDVEIRIVEETLAILDKQ